MKNISIMSNELAFIRSLDDFDLTMFLSDLHEHGWPIARFTLSLQAKARANAAATQGEWPTAESVCP